MEKRVVTPQEKRHIEVIARLDSITELLNDLKKDYPVEDTVTAAAKEYYTNADMCRILRITKRTLARYRQRKLVSYYKINGKVYYKVAEVQTFLQKKGKDSLEPELQTPE